MFMTLEKRMVEVRGIEPRSLGYLIEASTCIVCFLNFTLITLNKQTLSELAFKSHFANKGDQQSQPIKCPFSKPIGKILKKGPVYLNRNFFASEDWFNNLVSFRNFVICVYYLPRYLTRPTRHPRHATNIG